MLSLSSGEVAADTFVATYADGDNNASTGCSVTFPGGSFAGAETRLTVSVNPGATPAVSGVTRSDCAGGVFGAPVILSGGGPIGANAGTGGAEVIEFAVPESAVFASGSTVARVGFVGVSDASSDVLLTQNGAGGGSPILIVRSAVPIPSLGTEGALLLAVLMALAAYRAARLRSALGAALGLVLGAGVAWAAGFVVDGMIGDWSGEPVRATDAAGDAAGGSPAADLRASYFGLEGGVVFFRVDVTDLHNQAPTVTPQNVATNEDQALVIVLTGNDPEGQPITFAIASLPVGGILGPITPINATSASVLYTPGPNWNGPDSFKVTASDGLLVGPATTIGVIVNPVNDAPTATPKSHQTHSGIRVTIGPGASGLLKEGAADLDDPPADLSVSASFAAITPPGATITLTNPATGAFQYDPPPGYSGPASFTFQVCDDGAPAPPVLCGPATQVTFQITGPDLWFVDDSASPGGTGRLSSPFDALGDLPGGRGAGDRIFVFSGSYASGHALLASEQLIGQGATGVFDGLLGVISPPNGALDPRPSLGGARPQVGGTVAVAGGSLLRGLDLSTSAAVGLSGGAVSGVQVSEASVTSTGASAVSLNGTAGAFSLTSVSGSGAPAGILLSGTSGSFTVTGSGSPGSGGTIQNASIGVSLTSAQNVSLARMQLNDFGDFAIRGSSVANFALTDSVISGTNGTDPALDEGSVRFTGLTGSATISGSIISGSVEDTFAVVNSSGVLDRITFTNVTFGPMNASTGNDALRIETQGGAVANVTVQDSFFTAARGDHFDRVLNGTAASDLVFANNLLSNTGVAAVLGGSGIRLSGGNNSGVNPSATFAFTGNTLRDSSGDALAVQKTGGSGIWSGTIANNQIGVAAVPNSGAALGSDIAVSTDGGGTYAVTISGNAVRQYANFGILVQAGSSGVAGSGNLKATVTGNTIANPGTLAQNGFHLNNGTAAGDTYSTCLTLGGAGALANALTGSGASGNTDFRLRQRQATTVRLPGYGGSAFDTAAVVAFTSANNDPISIPTGSATVSSPPGGGFLGSACPF